MSRLFMQLVVANNSWSAVCFFMDGLITPFFKGVGNAPDDSVALISSVMGPASTNCFQTCFGIGSSTQDLGLEC